MAPLFTTVLSGLLANNLPKVAQAVVDKGLSYVEDKLGVEIKPDESGKLPPDLVKDLKIRAMQHEEFKIDQEYKNVADARDLQKKALEQDDSISKRFIYIFASFWSLFGAWYIYAITFTVIPEANTRIADMTSGFMLGTVLASMFTYFLGSSMGSAAKNKLLTAFQKDKQSDG